MKREPQSDSDDDRHSSKGGKNSSGSSSTRSKRFRGNDESIRILVPSKIAGALIGKGGQHINRLRSEFKSIINVEDCQGPERTLSISGEYENAVSVVEEMLKNFDEKDGEIDCRLLVHQSLAGCVIGKGGHKIKEVRDKIGCRVLKVFSNVCPQSSDRVMQCIGKLDHCLEAIREIYELIRDVPIRGPVHNYDPINYDDLFADKYGGFGMGGPDGGGGGGSGGGNSGGRGGGSSSGGGYHRGESGESSRYRDGGGSRFSSSDHHRRDEDRGGYSRRGGADMGGGGRRHESGSSGGGGRESRSAGGGRSSGGTRGREFIDPWAPNSGPPAAGGHFGSASGNGFGGSGGGGDSYGSSGGGGYGGSMSGGYGGSGGSNGSSMPGYGGGNAGHNSEYAGGHRESGGGAGDDKNTTQVTIPKDLAGAIIGKAGQRIRQIRIESNAFITIDEPLPGSTDRIITITGSPKEIQMAQYLLQQSVLE